MSNVEVGMSNVEVGYHPLRENYGYYLDKVPQNILKELGLQIDELQFDFNKGTKFNNHLAGEIEHEYQLKPQFQFKQYIKNLSQQFENKSQYMFSNYNPNSLLKFDTLWVNFQKKHEYNPIHHHQGVYSFVIWYQIPYLLENERSQFGYKSRSSHIHHGQFHFVFTNENNIILNPLNMDKTKEGYIAIFPSSLPHMVYPFYSSDEYRITIAGNVEQANNKLSDGDREQGVVLKRF